MFKPNFKYTDTIVNNLTQIAKAQTTIMNSTLVPKWEVSLRREALIRSAHSSTAIEGNALSLEEISLEEGLIQKGFLPLMLSMMLTGEDIMRY